MPTVNFTCLIVVVTELIFLFIRADSERGKNPACKGLKDDPVVQVFITGGKAY